MKRLAVVTAGLMVGASAFGADAPREWMELKQYTCSSVEVRDKLMAVFDTALIPALNRQGAKKVGVFWTDNNVNDGNADFNTSVFVLAAFADAEACLTAERKLLADAAFMKDAAPLFNAQMKEPLYDSCSSAVLQAFATCPTVEQAAKSDERIFQLRIYNSYTPERNAKKIAMFEAGGELALFRTCGMAPVFFGEAVAGQRLPNLTYMLAFENAQKKAVAWKAFVDSPEWAAMKADTQYKDTANKILNVNLRPSKGSQL
ncbi:MAG: NIPSNAP family protein [Kiritimatiellaeota bacterium]|nr:NIPSNAP family protein [Kiritimatiellota bacterium]